MVLLRRCILRNGLFAQKGAADLWLLFTLSILESGRLHSKNGVPMWICVLRVEFKTDCQCESVQPYVLQVAETKVHIMNLSRANHLN